jgi:AcrR family transcriptional regulator
MREPRPIGEPIIEPSRRERKKQRTRRDLAEAAIALFQRNGYANTTIEEIAAEADYSVSTLFRHFQGKEDIVFYDFPDRLQEMRAAFAKVDHGTAWSAIREALMFNAIRWDQDEEDFGVARARLFHREPALYARYVALGLEWEQEMADLIAREPASDADDHITTPLLAGAAVLAFRVAWHAQLAQPKTKLADHLREAFNQLEAGIPPSA